MSRIDPVLVPVPINALRPTQITVGLHEVNEKRLRWREQHGEHAAEFLGTHTVPVVKGPKGRFFVIDHHHLARALLEEGVVQLGVTVVARLDHLTGVHFWNYLDNRGWCHPYDAAGRRRDYDAIPRRIGEMPDDPYRSLAGALRRVGGFAKDTTPFSEFIWADFLRRHIAAKAVAASFDKALAKALKLARSREADYLPGWCGPVTGD